MWLRLFPNMYVDTPHTKLNFYFRSVTIPKGSSN